MDPANSGELIPVEVAYATPEKQHLLKLDIPAGSTAAEAIERSGICRLCPEIDLDQARIGIWNKLSTLEAPLEPRDRVEIYRPLKADPKEARRRRAREDQSA